MARILHSKLRGIQPLAEAAPIIGSRVELIDMPHYKTGEVLVRRDRPRARVVCHRYHHESPRASQQPVIKLMFGLSGSGPGLKLNNIAPLFMVRDKSALKRWLAAVSRRRRRVG
jgi:hypothetical protein